ncbi:DNA repair protein RadC [Clostridium sp.]|uniref:JAB domain-containing protein n=1 Tax=Clostridium sp. TaxID=1506 RepID=UPI001B713B39|nr:DNA repair protein RadC [Clostridium sp.]MBP3914654.1 DNA repair protein RadC [Clostridium sp.]
MKKYKGIQETLFNLEELSSAELLKLVLGKRTYEKKALDLSDLKFACLEEPAQYTAKEKEKIEALQELLKRGLPTDRANKISCPRDFKDELRFIAYEETENFVLICMNTKNQIIKKKILFKGGLNTSIVDPRVVFKEAIKYNSAAVAISHNHPSGDPSPSKEDISITERLKRSADLLGINFIDHIIVAKDSMMSFKEKGLI